MKAAFTPRYACSVIAGSFNSLQFVSTAQRAAPVKIDVVERSAVEPAVSVLHHAVCDRALA